MTTLLNYKEMTAHIRSRLKASGIKAKCKMSQYCGVKAIYITPVTFNDRFSESEQKEILLIAKTNKLTLAKGCEINLDQMTYANEATFEFHSN